jgi:hypothetical protein
VGLGPAADRTAGAGLQREPAGRVGQHRSAVAAQLTTALANAGNIRIIDWDFYQQNGGNPAKLVNKKANEVGPFVVRGVVTEFNEIAEATGSTTGGSLGALARRWRSAARSPAMRPRPTPARAGARQPGLPEHGRTPHRLGRDGPQDRRSGNGRLVSSVMANGSFSSESAANGFSLFGFGTASNAYAASALARRTAPR